MLATRWSQVRVMFLESFSVYFGLMTWYISLEYQIQTVNRPWPSAPDQQLFPFVDSKKLKGLFPVSTPRRPSTAQHLNLACPSHIITRLTGTEPPDLFLRSFRVSLPLRQIHLRGTKIHFLRTLVMFLYLGFFFISKTLESKVELVKNSILCHKSPDRVRSVCCLLNRMKLAVTLFYYLQKQTRASAFRTWSKKQIYLQTSINLLNQIRLHQHFPLCRPWTHNLCTVKTQIKANVCVSFSIKNVLSN